MDPATLPSSQSTLQPEQDFIPHQLSQEIRDIQSTTHHVIRRSSSPPNHHRNHNHDHTNNSNATNIINNNNNNNNINNININNISINNVNNNNHPSSSSPSPSSSSSTSSSLDPSFQFDLLNPHFTDQELFPNSAFEGLRRFREQMDRIYRQSTNTLHRTVQSFNQHHPQPYDTSHPHPLPQDSILSDHTIRRVSDPQELETLSIHPLRSPRFSPPLLPPMISESTTHHPPQPSTDSPSDDPTPDPPTLQNRTHEFIHHSSRMRLNRRHRLSPLPNPSNDHNILESLESFRRCGERRKRVQTSIDGFKLENHDSSPQFHTESTEPTTAELAEAAARASNEHNALPAFYSPDQSLVITKVVIPVDTNPMERRKIIFDASKDGTIRWNDSNQKAVYERSKDGLVGEEIGEIEFSYISLPQKKKVTLDKKPSTDSLDSTPSSFRAARSSLTDRQTIDGSLSSDTERAIREALERMNRARNSDHHHYYSSRSSNNRDHPTYHSNRYQIYQHPRYRLVATSRRNLPFSRDFLDSTHNQSTRNPNSTLSIGIPRETDPVMNHDSRQESTDRLLLGESNRRSSNSMNRLTRRPFVFLERQSLHRIQSNSLSTSHDPFFFGPSSNSSNTHQSQHQHQHGNGDNGSENRSMNRSTPNDPHHHHHHHHQMSRSSSSERIDDYRNDDSLYNQFYNPHHHYSSLDHLILNDY